MRHRSRVSRWPRSVLVVLAFGGLVGGCDRIEQAITQGGAINEAKTRVDSVWSNLTQEGYEEETAICMWAAGKLRITDMARFEAAYDDFHAWMDSSGFNVRGGQRIRSYQLVDAQPLEEGSDVVVVTVELDGRQRKLRVAPNVPLDWHR